MTRCSSIMAAKPASTWRASISAGTRAGCTARPSSATASTRSPIRGVVQGDARRILRALARARRGLTPMPRRSGPGFARAVRRAAGRRAGDRSRRHASPAPMPSAEQLLNLSERAMLGQPLDTRAASRRRFAQPRRAGLCRVRYRDRDGAGRATPRRLSRGAASPIGPAGGSITLHHAATSRRIGHDGRSRRRRARGDRRGGDAGA